MKERITEQKALKEGLDNQEHDHLSWQDIDFIIENKISLRHVTGKDQAAQELLHGTNGDALKISAINFIDESSYRKHLDIFKRFGLTTEEGFVKPKNKESLHWYENSIKSFLRNSIEAFGNLGSLHAFFLIKGNDNEPAYDADKYGGIPKRGRGKIDLNQYIAMFQVQEPVGTEIDSKIIDELTKTAWELFIQKVREMHKKHETEINN